MQGNSLYKDWYMYENLLHRAYLYRTPVGSRKERTLCDQIFQISWVSESTLPINFPRCDTCSRLSIIIDLAE